MRQNTKFEVGHNYKVVCGGNGIMSNYFIVKCIKVEEETDHGIYRKYARFELKAIKHEEIEMPYLMFEILKRWFDFGEFNGHRIEDLVNAGWYDDNNEYHDNCLHYEAVKFGDGMYIYSIDETKELD